MSDSDAGGLESNDRDDRDDPWRRAETETETGVDLPLPPVSETNDNGALNSSSGNRDRPETVDARMMSFGDGLNGNMAALDAIDSLDANAIDAANAAYAQVDAEVSAAEAAVTAAMVAETEAQALALAEAEAAANASDALGAEIQREQSLSLSKSASRTPLNASENKKLGSSQTQALAKSGGLQGALGQPQDTVAQSTSALNASKSKKKGRVTIDANTVKKIAHWPSSRRNTASRSHKTGDPAGRSTPPSLKPAPPDYFVDDPQPIVRRRNGKYEEIPHLLDGFRMLNRAPAEDPEDVYTLDISSQELLYVIEDDMTLFTKLHTLRAGENALPFARLGILPGLKKLVLPCNGVTSLDLDVDGRFQKLEHLDLSFNAIDQAAQIVIATLPCLKYLDLTSNSLSTLAPDIMNMDRWRDRVIELLLPNQVAALDAGLFARPPPVPSSLDISRKQSLGQPAGAGHSHSRQLSLGLPTPSTAASAVHPANRAPATAPSVSVAGGGGGGGGGMSLKSDAGGHDVPYSDYDDQAAPFMNRTAPSEVTAQELRDQQIAMHLTKNGISSSVDSVNEDDEGSVFNSDSVTTRGVVGHVGFAVLESLVLENNKLGASGSTEFWLVLASLPSLRVLNLNSNSIRSLGPLIPVDMDDELRRNPQSILSMSPRMIAKCDGFVRLAELHLRRNRVATLDDLAGLVCLPRIQRVFLEGNPVMGGMGLPRYTGTGSIGSNALAGTSGPAGNMASTSTFTASAIDAGARRKLATGTGGQKKPDTDIFSMLSHVHGIQIADSCYLPPKSCLDATEVIAIGPVSSHAPAMSTIGHGHGHGFGHPAAHNQGPVSGFPPSHASPAQPPSTMALLAPGLSMGVPTTVRGVAGLNMGVLRLQKQSLKPPPKRPHFIGNYVGKATHVQLGHHVVSHLVPEPAALAPPKHAILARQTRRRYQFTDADLEAIVKMGRIPGVKELAKIAEMREAQAAGVLSASATGSGRDGMGNAGIGLQRTKSPVALGQGYANTMQFGTLGGMESGALNLGQGDASGMGSNLNNLNDPRVDGFGGGGGGDDGHSLVSAPTESDVVGPLASSMRGRVDLQNYEPRLPQRGGSNRSTNASVRSFDTFGESMTLSLQEIMYDPNHIDDTFLTGVHITGSRRRKPKESGDGDDADAVPREADEAAGGDSEAGFDEDDEDSGSEYSDSDSDGSGSSGSGSDSGSDSGSAAAQTATTPDDVDNEQMDKVYPLPNSIQGSVKALRHALSNPVSYWRIMEESYARPTYASLKRNTAFITREQLRNEAVSATAALADETRQGTRAPTTRSDAHAHATDAAVDAIMSGTSRFGGPDAEGGERPGSKDDQSALSAPSTTVSTAPNLVTPANSVWTPIHGEEQLLSIADYMPPTEFSTRGKAPVGVVMYRKRADLPIGQKGALADIEDQRRLQYQLEAKLKQRNGGKPMGGNARAASGQQAGYSNLQELSGDAGKRQQSLQKRLVAAAALQRAQLGGRLRPKDEFEELDDLMTTVDAKLNTIEANLANVLRSSQLQEQLPQSSRLLKELQSEYTRIENMYLQDAKVVVQSEPLSQRLRKLGIGSHGAGGDAASAAAVASAVVAAVTGSA
ncbi:hypothetical protein BC831DRAFT_512530 [Entophlyctis helioformis]|nr:hypothetical protein BC831DRAFT_512530 [Entophlyctis helioformis]